MEKSFKKLHFNAKIGALSDKERHQPPPPRAPAAGLFANT
jgi:hypothetical protein